LNVLYPGHNAAGLAALHISATTEHIKLTVKDNGSYVEMFSLIEQCVTVDGIDKVVSDAGYAAARNANNPILSYNIIRRVHSLQMHNIGAPEAQYLASQRYNRIRMQPGMSLGDYRASMLLATANMQTTGVNPLPNDLAMARHFLMH
jgi:hypothetical protein